MNRIILILTKYSDHNKSNIFKSITRENNEQIENKILTFAWNTSIMRSKRRIYIFIRKTRVVQKCFTLITKQSWLNIFK